MHQPGKSTWVSRLHSSWHQHCRTLHSSWGQRTMWQAGVWQRTHSHLQPPTRTENTSYCWPHQSNGNKQEQSQLQWSAIKVLQKTIFLIQSLYITNSGKMACTPATRDICADNTFNITLMTKLTKKIQCDMGLWFNKYLMCSAYEVKIVFMQELGYNFWSKCEGNSTVVLSPAHGFFVGIRPQEITQETLVRHVCRAHDPANLLHGL